MNKHYLAVSRYIAAVRYLFGRRISSLYLCILNSINRFVCVSNGAADILSEHQKGSYYLPTHVYIYNYS